MKTTIALPFVAIMMLAGVDAALAGNLQDQVKVEIQSAELRQGMQPGTYVCDAGHLHVKGTVQNLADVPVGPVKVAGKALDAEGKLLGTATASTKRPVLNPNDTTDVDLEFLAVTGSLVKQVKSEELSVVGVAPSP